MFVQKIWILTIPSPMLLTTHGTKAVDPVCDVTIVLFSVAKWTGGLSKGGNEAANSFISSADSKSVSEINQPINYLNIFWFITYKSFFSFFIFLKENNFVFPLFSFDMKGNWLIFFLHHFSSRMIFIIHIKCKHINNSIFLL